MGRNGTNFPLKDFYGDIHATYDRVNRIFTFGRDSHWRRRAAKACLDSAPGEVLDICTGTGDFILELAVQAAEGVRLTGYDFSSEMLQEARRKLRILEGRAKIPSVQFVEGSVANIPFADGQFDAIGITFGIRNLIYENTDAAKHLAEINRVLQQGGVLVILESSNPSNALWRFFNSFYLRMILPYLGGLISGNFSAYRYLATSSRNYYSIGEMGDILERAGFKVASAESLFLGSVMLLVAVKK
jgi:demethylmenaquinone methyltransferase/2-methoxy-6-polyprenyl-1,4-benzoquinol methylase